MSILPVGGKSRFVEVKLTLVGVKSTLVGVKSTLSKLSRPLVRDEFCRVELPFPKRRAGDSRNPGGNVMWKNKFLVTKTKITIKEKFHPRKLPFSGLREQLVLGCMTSELP